MSPPPHSRVPTRHTHTYYPDTCRHSRYPYIPIHTCPHSPHPHVLIPHILLLRPYVPIHTCLHSPRPYVPIHTRYPLLTPTRSHPHVLPTPHTYTFPSTHVSHSPYPHVPYTYVSQFPTSLRPRPVSRTVTGTHEWGRRDGPGWTRTRGQGEEAGPQAPERHTTHKAVTERGEPAVWEVRVDVDRPHEKYDTRPVRPTP